MTTTLKEAAENVTSFYGAVKTEAEKVAYKNHCVILKAAGLPITLSLEEYLEHDDAKECVENITTALINMGLKQ